MIEGALEVVSVLGAIGVKFSPGFIGSNVGARGKSVKLKILNPETCELVVITNVSKQTLKAYGKPGAEIWSALQGLATKGWRVHDPIDLSQSREV